MKVELVIDARPTGVVIAILHDGKLIELHHERESNDFSVGDVYLGKVRKVVPSLNAAFVNVGYEKDAFLHYLDLGPQYLSMQRYTKNAVSGKLKDKLLANAHLEKDIDKEGKITDVVSSSQNILVQVAKEPISSKGPRLSADVTLAGRFLVLVPFSDKISISQKIESKEERNRLKRLLSSIKPKNFGVIIRTVAQGQKVAELDQDLTNLVEKWKKMATNLRKSDPPKRVLGELSTTSALLRDLLNGNFENIHVNSDEVYDEVLSFLETTAPEHVSILKRYSGKVDIFQNFGLQKQIKALFGRQVPLSGGGYLIVEHTEAMHVIDVNSGNRKGGGDTQEENALSTNLDAATEIARVLRLRDMGGIVAVDFIDLHGRENNKKLHDHMKECMKGDRAKFNVLAPSRFGVVEITRQRVRPQTNIKTAESCPTCKGTGEVQATILIIDEIENNLRYLIEDKNEKDFTLACHPFLDAFIKRGIMSIKHKWLLNYKRNIKVVSNTEYHMLEYQFLDAKGNIIEL